MAILVDSCILLRLFDRASPDHAHSRAAIRKLLARNESVVISAQNAAEFWNASTRPVQHNGYGLSPAKAHRRLTILERFCRVLPETERAYALWRQIVVGNSVVGVAVHEARLVAVMGTWDVSDLLTLNVRDFRRYAGIAVWTPQMVLAQA
jgi:predicted nucleic acid-binding protein